MSTPSVGGGLDPQAGSDAAPLTDEEYNALAATIHRQGQHVVLCGGLVGCCYWSATRPVGGEWLKVPATLEQLLEHMGKHTRNAPRCFCVLGGAAALRDHETVFAIGGVRRPHGLTHIPRTQDGLKWARVGSNPTKGLPQVKAPAPPSAARQVEPKRKKTTKKGASAGRKCKRCRAKASIMDIDDYGVNLCAKHLDDYLDGYPSQVALSLNGVSGV